jgi:type VI protein secretion system component VasF
MHFVERFFKLVHHVLEISAGNDRRSWASVSLDLSELIAKEESRALPPGFSEQDREDCLAPVLLWIDETLLNSRREDAADWYDHSLQRRLFDTNQGGDVFFRRLEALLSERRRLFDAPMAPEPEDRPEPRTPMERLVRLWVEPGQGPDPLESRLDAFALCLVLGYRGRLIDAPGDEPSRLLALSKAQLKSWADKEPEVPAVRGGRFRLRPLLADEWRNHGWILIHVLVPAAIVFVLWLKFSRIVANLPF